MPIESAINLSFTFFCGVLVILMQLGFAMLESGLNSYKNTANILFKNMADLCIGAIIFYTIGYHIMFPEHFASANFLLGVPPGKGVHWFYQMAFAATACTIVSGAVAGRMQFKAYLMFSGFLGGIVYPIVGRLCWSETGYFYKMGFHDLAGSVVVHGVGGMAAFAAILVLRPRQGRFFPGFVGHHNLVFALLGTLLLWVGWYGFNAGSIGDLVGSDTIKFARIIENTTLGAAAGALAGMFFGLIPYRKKLNLKAAMNGALGGLVSVTANCDIITAPSALFIGTIAGLFVIFGEILLEQLKLDDTVGAVPVHGICGIWGGLATAFFTNNVNFGTQLLTIITCLSCVFFTMYLFFKLLKALGWLEVSLEDEQRGLDLSEHDLEAYRPSFREN